ncbi:tRNA(Ile)-lysidine synthetase [Sphaceloma murrayae]|uniref:tRNA(Ile)-lysidine synthetase n=1 Tax=Sphaceloma murrayae TaxID=2082308 RepID=A0A2K1QTQ6_9PEZI|nr:tRNA(Ile)-lysidine synthetase [Sphaceloma murrayae]
MGFKQLLKDIRPISQTVFNDILRPIWLSEGRRAKIGIALSGGSDSMALAHLCHHFQSNDYNSRPLFTAFIVDHGVRPGSLEEAHRIRNFVSSKMGRARIATPAGMRDMSQDDKNAVDVKILKLAWNTNVHPSKLPNFESAARRLRYQALAKACLVEGITTLLLGHHADDQAETVLLRLKGGYLGSGLQGMSRVADIPECNGMYGYKSGDPRRVTVNSGNSLPLIKENARDAMIEDGGIKIHRPLLGFTKKELQATCLANRVMWVEDETNKDPTLTVRNTAREMLDQDRLPAALSRDSLLKYAERLKASEETEAKVVDSIFKSCNIVLDLATGGVEVRFPPDIMAVLDGGEGSVTQVRRRSRAAKLLRKIIVLASPTDKIPLEDTGQALRMTFPSLFIDKASAETMHGGVTSVGKVLYHVTKPASDTAASASTVCRIVRAPPTAKDQLEQRRVLQEEVVRRSESFEWTSTGRQLFDGRWWIKLRFRKFNLIPGRRLSVRFLQSKDIEALNRDASKYTVFKPLKDLLRTRAPGSTRFTLPAIIESYYTITDAGQRELAEKLVALPTLNWSSVGWQPYDKHARRDGWTWELRYKKVDLGQGPGHKFIA